jgi:cupin fold WbuC family metalloprotein
MVRASSSEVDGAGKPIAPASLREVAPGIFYASEPIVVADAAMVDFLKQHASTNAVRRARVCAHPVPEAEQHDMLIVSHRDTYVAPHRHLSKSESFLVIEGEADVLLFEEDGSLLSQFLMGSAQSGHAFFYRMPARRYHSLRIRSEFLVFAEATRGPFDKADMQNAPWAPAPHEAAAGMSFIQALVPRLD